MTASTFSKICLSLLVIPCIINIADLAVGKTPKTPPKHPGDGVFIQLWMTRSELDSLKRTCSSYTILGPHVKFMYGNGLHVELPCSVIQEVK